jgi:phospholipid/cholesterol/gamma-HCH transport system substrate-binding protein
MDTAPTGPGRGLLQLRVGAFILAALAVFVGLVYFLGRQAGLFERHYTLIAAFAQIAGLTEGATVRLAGVPVGRVTAVRLPETGAARVRVELTLVRRVQARIRTDSVARIETLGLLGDKIVEVTLGSAEAAVLAAGAELQTEEPVDTNRLVNQGTELLRNLLTISADLRTTLGALTQSDIGPDLADATRSLRRLLAEVEQGQGLLHVAIYDKQVGAGVAELPATLRRVREAAQRLDRLLADPQATGLATEVGRAVSEGRAALGRVNRLVRQVEEGRGLLHALIYGESRVLQDLDGLLARAGAVVAAVERGDGALGVLVRDPDTARAVKRLARAADGVADVVDRAREADGLLQALLFDPEGKAVVADLRQTVRLFRDVTARVARGEGLLGQLTEPGSEEVAKQLAQGLGGLGRLAARLGEEPGLAEAIHDLREAMGNLRTITARLEAGDGTLGGLLVDPTIYENLAAFLEGAQRSVLLRALIRGAIDRGTSER